MAANDMVLSLIVEAFEKASRNWRYDPVGLLRAEALFKTLQELCTDLTPKGTPHGANCHPTARPAGSD